ncbi:MAG: Do family serine endopeptidase [Alphaproteobacteria bacterium]
MTKRLALWGGLWLLGVVAFGSVLGGTSKAEREEKIIPPSREAVQYSYAPLIREVAPAVVNIYTTRMVQRSRSLMFNDPFFRQFFGDRFGRGDDEPQERKQNHSLGSGVLVGEGGVVVTNNHVVAGADEIVVVLADRREFVAEVIVADERTDLAVLRIDTNGEDLPHLTFQDSDDVEVGDLVFAIGNPFGIGQTVTSGIVSAVARTQVGISDYEFFIQTDAAINPGNSGGALVGIDGTLYGINTVILSRSGGSHGVGFAIPANMVSRVVSDAITEGKVVRAWLGASGQPVTSALAESLGLDRPIGALVNSIYEGGPADDAGLEVGDVVLEIEGNPVADPQSLASRLATQEIGSKAELRVLRDGEMETIRIVIEPAPEDPPRNETELIGDHIFDGATVANLSPALADELRLDPMETGVIILAVNRRGGAARSGFRPGDIFVEINGEPIESVAMLDAYWATYSGTMDVSIRRRGRVMTDRFRQ